MRKNGTDGASPEKGKPLTEVDRAQAISLAFKGLSVRAIATELDVSPTAVWRALEAYRTYEKLKAESLWPWRKGCRAS